MSEEQSRVPQEMLHAITQHYYTEARWLQERLYREWLDQMVARDIHYWAPIFEERLKKDKRPAPTPDDAAYYNDTYKDLQGRVERLYTGMVWMEDPPSRIRYMISNVEAFSTPNANEFVTYCNILVMRNRRQIEAAQHSLGRQDLLRLADGKFQVAKRKITVDARVVQDMNLYFFI